MRFGIPFGGFGIPFRNEFWDSLGIPEFLRGFAGIPFEIRDSLQNYDLVFFCGIRDSPGIPFRTHFPVIRDSFWDSGFPSEFSFGVPLWDSGFPWGSLQNVFSSHLGVPFGVRGSLEK